MKKKRLQQEIRNYERNNPNPTSKCWDQSLKKTSMKIKIQKSKIKYNYNNRKGINIKI